MKNKPETQVDAATLVKWLYDAGMRVKTPESEELYRHIRLVGHPIPGHEGYESKWRIVASGAAAFHPTESEKILRANCKNGFLPPGIAWEDVEVKITGQDGEDIWLQSDVL
jgi:hypothetical protein